MKPVQDVDTVAIIGAGLIGAGWAAYFLAKGLAVRCYDPAPDAEARTAAVIDAAWPFMVQAGIASGSSRSPTFHSTIAETCAGAGFVQENGPEQVEGKRALLAQIDAATAPDVVIASSSSSLLPSDYQGDAAYSGRILAAHPFNPPSLVPLVEIAGGAQTTAEAVDWAMAFFAHVGKAPIRVRKETPGYIANRMTAALYREAVDLVASGVASVEDVDTAISQGPGLRWAAMGPHLLYHLGGGPGGYRAYLDHLGPAQERRWASLKASPLSEDLKARLVRELSEAIGGADIPTLEARRDGLLASILALKA